MNTSKLKKDVLVPLGISVAGCAIWAGIVWLKENISGAKVPHPGGSDVFQFAYITIIAFAGYFFGARSKTAELSEVYADVILSWLKDHCHTVCTFTTEHMALNVALPNEKTLLGLQRLQKYELVVKSPLVWKYSAVSAVGVAPGYKRLVRGVIPAEDNVKSLTAHAEMQEHHSEALQTLPVYRQELDVSILTMCAGTSLGKATVFIQIKLWARRDLNMTKIAGTIGVDNDRYEVTPLADLTEWILVEQVIDQRNRKNSKDSPLSTLSLVQEIEAGLFREGHHEPRWLGFELPLRFITDEQVKTIRLAFHDKYGVAKSELFREWPKTDARVIDAEFRR